MRTIVEAQLSAKLNAKIVHELLEAPAEAKRNYYLGGLRLAEVEGGRFCEAAFRLLEQIEGGSFTPLGRQLDVEKLTKRLENLSRQAQPDSVRIHLPRALRLVYDIRSKRDAVHLADGIDPNLQDATLVVSVLDWILAEFVRLFHQVSAEEARVIVDSIVARSAPIVQDFDGFLKVLNPRLDASEHCLVLLYQRGKLGATFQELRVWVRPKMRQNLRRTLGRLVSEKDMLHSDGARYQITRLGQNEVENRRLVDPINHFVAEQPRVPSMV